MGLNLQSFLTHRPDARGGQFVRDWKDDGWIEFWLHTRADFYPHWYHSFVAPDQVEEKGETKRILRFPKFTCWEPEAVCAKQNFTNETETARQLPPTSCPFDLLKDWLRFSEDAEQIPLDSSVFVWDRPQESRRRGDAATIEWSRGHLAGLVERGQAWDETIDAKLRYLFVVVVHPDEKAKKEDVIAKLFEGPKMVGQLMQDLIRKEIKSNGEVAGNPIETPYCIRLEYDEKEKVPFKKYQAMRVNKNVLSATIREAIMSDDFPDPSTFVAIGNDDGAKIRSMMELAAERAGTDKILPWDLIFPARSGGRRQEPAEKKSTRTPEVRSDRRATGSVDLGKPLASASKQETKAAPAAPAAGAKRRRLVEPEEEQLPCDRCKKPFGASLTKCPHCGAVYEMDEVEGPGNGAGQPDVPVVESQGPDSAGVDVVKCWSCKAERPDTAGQCPNCNVAADDDIPSDPPAR